MKTYNVWESVSGMVYEMEITFLPKFGGFELIGTIEKPTNQMPRGYVNRAEYERVYGIA